MSEINDLLIGLLGTIVGALITLGGSVVLYFKKIREIEQRAQEAQLAHRRDVGRIDTEYDIKVKELVQAQFQTLLDRTDQRLKDTEARLIQVEEQLRHREEEYADLSEAYTRLRVESAGLQVELRDRKRQVARLKRQVDRLERGLEETSDVFGT